MRRIHVAASPLSWRGSPVRDARPCARFRAPNTPRMPERKHVRVETTRGPGLRVRLRAVVERHAGGLSPARRRRTRSTSSRRRAFRWRTITTLSARGLDWYRTGLIGGGVLAAVLVAGLTGPRLPRAHDDPGGGRRRPGARDRPSAHESLRRSAAAPRRAQGIGQRDRPRRSSGRADRVACSLAQIPTTRTPGAARVRIGRIGPRAAITSPALDRERIVMTGAGRRARGPSATARCVPTRASREWSAGGVAGGAGRKHPTRTAGRAPRERAERHRSERIACRHLQVPRARVISIGSRRAFREHLRGEDRSDPPSATRRSRSSAHPWPGPRARGARAARGGRSYRASRRRHACATCCSDANGDPLPTSRPARARRRSSRRFARVEPIGLATAPCCPRRRAPDRVHDLPSRGRVRRRAPSRPRRVHARSARGPGAARSHDQRDRVRSAPAACCSIRTTARSISSEAIAARGRRSAGALPRGRAATAARRAPGGGVRDGCRARDARGDGRGADRARTHRARTGARRVAAHDAWRRGRRAASSCCARPGC